ncbi:ribonucleoside triphosphate reductase [Haloplasma contractile]|uniref:Ribonucleoside-triphosphate reductase protein n=1 Tax=Haloplasma contractile SSD-17B TaxID=1033810 RepID=F7PTS3_9MOLU|nr:ribonucleoside triphosphate reductase [Haloplasma contractile]ERJ12236.1 ribonucleoside-triphosphate reductase protein [Haloplasma contractile SSD-17B]
MVKYVCKRSGKIEEFDEGKIETAIIKAMKSVEDFNKIHHSTEEQGKLATQVVVFKISQKIKDETIELEEIQNIVEETLMDLGLKTVARNYIRYRYQHEHIRNDKSTFINVTKMVDEYRNKTDWKVNENSNMDYSLQGLNNHIVSEVTKDFWLNHIFTEEQKKLHKDGDLHIHDLGLLSPYCCGWDLEKLLLKGFTGVKNKVQSKPPKHFRTALLQLVNFFYTLQGEAAGAQAVSSLDTYLAPFIRFDQLNYLQVKQAMQEFIYNLNVPTRVGFQTPFVNITMDLKPSSIMKNQPVIVGGEHHDDYTYGDFEEEMNLINRAFCEVMMEGDASGRVFTFPIPTYNIDSDFDWDNDVVDLIMEMTSKYGIPYFANFVNSDMSPEDARSMCCRLRLDNRELRKRGGGLFGANPLTGSIGVVTINLPRIGYTAKTKNEFYKRLKILMDEARYVLEIKRKIIEKNTQDGLYPFSKYYLEEVYERFNEYWKNHFNTIGINGMNECIQNFFNNHEDITTENGQTFANEVLDFMREAILDYQDDGNLYNLEATPAEGTGYRLAMLDTKKYPDIITAGAEEPYYTNSTHLPVGFSDDLFEVLDLQDELQSKYTGGTVLHGFLGEQITDEQQTKSLLQTVFKHYKLPYFSITPTFSICINHGYLKGEQRTCPHCQKQTEVWTRVVGFYRPVQNFNKGKKEEYKDRQEYVVESRG